VRQQDSRGLRVGESFDDLTEIKEREFEVMGEPILPFTGDRRVIVSENWDVAGQICAEQADPLPARSSGSSPRSSWDGHGMRPSPSSARRAARTSTPCCRGCAPRTRST
jgi:hypothetical protein